MQNLNLKTHWPATFLSRSTWPVLAAAMDWLVLDLVTKWMASGWLDKPVVLIDRFLSLTYHQNTGIAFGWMFGRWSQIVVSVLILGGLVWFGLHEITSRKEGFINQVILGIIIGGALGNLVNRFYPGYVIDFISLYPFPIFNLADVGITLGLIAFALRLSFNKNN